MVLIRAAYLSIDMDADHERVGRGTAGYRVNTFSSAGFAPLAPAVQLEGWRSLTPLT